MLYSAYCLSAAPLPRCSSRGDDAEPLDSLSNFTRFYEGGKGAELQTAVVSYYPRRRQFPWSVFQPRQQVDLVAAVHIADKLYFSKLQRDLDEYDCVLYEMVVDKGKGTGRGRWRPSKARAKQREKKFSFNVISAIQRLMARALKLDFQLECMNYEQAHWYHADLDIETFKRLQREKGESLLSFALELTKLSLAAAPWKQQDSGLDPLRNRLKWASRVFPMPLVGLFLIEGVCAPLDASAEMKALFNLDIVNALKLFLARQLTTDLSDGAFALLKNSVIIGERNRVAMRELDDVINKEGLDKVAIFYGSGHLPDMDARLRAMGFYPEKISWRTAWSIRSSSSSSRGSVSAEKRSWSALDRYQTAALAVLSMVFALDLWFWELFFESLRDGAEQLVVGITSILDAGWRL